MLSRDVEAGVLEGLRRGPGASKRPGSVLGQIPHPGSPPGRKLLGAGMWRETAPHTVHVGQGKGSDAGGTQVGRQGIGLAVRPTLWP